MFEKVCINWWKIFRRKRKFVSLPSRNWKIIAKKGNRIQVILECTEHKATGQPGTSRYVTTKNRKNTPDRMEIKKYNRVLRRYTVHKEIK